MLPAIRDLAGDVFMFQQDSVPAHRACATVKYLLHPHSYHLTYGRLTALTLTKLIISLVAVLETRVPETHT